MRLDMEGQATMPPRRGRSRPGQALPRLAQRVSLGILCPASALAAANQRRWRLFSAACLLAVLCCAWPGRLLSQRPTLFWFVCSFFFFLCRGLLAQSHGGKSRDRLQAPAVTQRGTGTRKGTVDEGLDRAPRLVGGLVIVLTIQIVIHVQTLVSKQPFWACPEQAKS